MGSKTGFRTAVASATVLVCLVERQASAGVIYSDSSATYIQNFNTLAASTTPTQTPAWANDSTVPGWYAALANASTPATYTVSTGSAAAQNQIVSLGSSNVAERALGSQSPDGASTGPLRYGVQLINGSTEAFTAFSLSYKGEQWRRSQATDTNVDTLAFEYQVFPAGSTNPLTATTGWTAFSSLNFDSPNMTAPVGTGTDGNSATYSRTLSGSPSGMNWQPGQELWLRWTDTAGTSTFNRRFMMGIDDVTFTVVPEPASIGLLAVGAVGLLARRLRG